jgi:hypothetical protein
MTRRLVLALLATSVALALSASASGSASASASSTRGFKISSIHYAQAGTNLNTEYIVIKNTSTKRHSITGWKIISAPSSDNQHYVFPKTIVAAGASVTLYTGTGVNSRGKRYWNAGSPRWNNDGDKAVLKNSRGKAVDTCQYAGGGTTTYC